MTDCQDCGTQLKPLFGTKMYCPNDCDRKEKQVIDVEFEPCQIKWKFTYDKKANDVMKIIRQIANGNDVEKNIQLLCSVVPEIHSARASKVMNHIHIRLHRNIALDKIPRALIHSARSILQEHPTYYYKWIVLKDASGKRQIGAIV